MADETINDATTEITKPESGQTYLCKHRNLRFSAEEVQSGRSLGGRCYLGSKENFCNLYGRLCDVIQAYKNELAQSLHR